MQVIAVFREEAKGVEGLKKIKEKTEVDFALAIDNGKKQTGRYTSGKMKFHSYLIGRDGKVAAIIQGDLKNRAKSKQLLDEVKAMSEGK